MKKSRAKEVDMNYLFLRKSPQLSPRLRIGKVMTSHGAGRTGTSQVLGQNLIEECCLKPYFDSSIGC